MWVFTVGELSVRDLDNPSSPPPFGCPATSTTKMPEAPSEDQIIAIVARRGPLLARLFDAEHAHLPLQEQQRERRRRRFVLANRIKSLVGTPFADKLDPFQLYTVSEHGLEDEADSDHVGDMSLLEQPSPAEAIPLLDMNSFLLSKPIQPLSPKLALATQAVLEPYPPVPVRKRVHGKQKSKDETAGGLGAEGGDAFIPKRHKHTDLLHKPGYQLYAFQLKAQAQPLHKLLSTAQKVVMTKDWQLAREESKQLKVLSRIDELKSQNMWSLRQLKPSIPLVPQVGKSQRELMMDEMRWMSEDFREERKWKMGMASLCARWVVEWHSVTDKSLLCIKARPLNFINLSTEYYASMAQPGLVPAITVQDVTMEEATAPCTISPTGSVSKVEIAAKGEGLAQIVNMYDSETENDEAGAPSTAAVPPPAFSSEATTNPSAMVVDPPTTVIYSSAPTIAAVTKAPQLTVLPTNEGPQIIPVTTSTAHAPIIFDMSKLTYTYSTPAKTPHHISNSIFAPPNLSDIYPPTPNSMVAAEDIQPFAPSLFHSQLVAKDYTRWDEHGRLKGYGYLESEEEDGAIVDGEAAVSSKDSTLFGKSDAGKRSDKIPTPSGAPPPDATLAKTVWTTEEDALLVRMVDTEAHYNWPFIAETLSSLRLGAGDRRREWDCYARYKSLVETRNGGGGVPGEADAGLSGKTRKVDAQKRFGKKLSSFELIILKARARGERMPRNPTSRKVNLASHDTHKAAQDNAGVNLATETMTPNDIAQIKEKREREILIHQQNARFLSMNSRMGPLMQGVRPPSGLPFMQYPLPNPLNQLNQFRPAPRPGMPLPTAPTPTAAVPGTTLTTTAAGATCQSVPGIGMQRTASTPSVGSVPVPNGGAASAQAQVSVGLQQGVRATPEQVQQMQQLMAQQLMQRAAGPGIAGQAGPPAPVDMTLQQQQQQAANMQMRLMLQQQLLFAQQQQGGAVRPPGFGDSNLAAMMAMQNAQGRPNMPLDSRQWQMLQAQQLQQQIAAAGGGVTPTVGSAPSPLTSSLNLPGATSAIAPTPTSVSEPSKAEKAAKPDKAAKAPTNKQNQAADASLSVDMANEDESANAVPASSSARGSRSSKPSPTTASAGSGNAATQKKLPTRIRKRIKDDTDDEEEESEHEDDDDAAVEEEEEEEDEKPSRRSRRSDASGSSRRKKK